MARKEGRKPPAPTAPPPGGAGSRVQSAAEEDPSGTMSQAPGHRLREQPFELRKFVLLDPLDAFPRRDRGPVAEEPALVSGGEKHVPRRHPPDCGEERLPVEGLL